MKTNDQVVLGQKYVQLVKYELLSGWFNIRNSLWEYIVSCHLARNICNGRL